MQPEEAMAALWALRADVVFVEAFLVGSIDHPRLDDDFAVAARGLTTESDIDRLAVHKRSFYDAPGNGMILFWFSAELSLSASSVSTADSNSISKGLRRIDDTTALLSRGRCASFMAVTTTTAGRGSIPASRSMTSYPLILGIMRSMTATA